jgi:hypothetical protein
VQQGHVEEEVEGQRPQPGALRATTRHEPERHETTRGGAAELDSRGVSIVCMQYSIARSSREVLYYSIK